VKLYAVEKNPNAFVTFVFLASFTNFSGINVLAVYRGEKNTNGLGA
jgi:hypothetical protein